MTARSLQAALEALEREVRCPICLDCFVDPHQLTGCKHNFCGGCLEQALRLKELCPVCGLEAKRRSPMADPFMARLVVSIQETCDVLRRGLPLELTRQPPKVDLCLPVAVEHARRYVERAAANQGTGAMRGQPMQLAEILELHQRIANKAEAIECANASLADLATAIAVRNDHGPRVPDGAGTVHAMPPPPPLVPPVIAFVAAEAAPAPAISVMSTAATSAAVATASRCEEASSACGRPVLDALSGSTGDGMRGRDAQSRGTCGHDMRSCDANALDVPQAEAAGPGSSQFKRLSAGSPSAPPLTRSSAPPRRAPSSHADCGSATRRASSSRATAAAAAASPCAASSAPPVAVGSCRKRAQGEERASAMGQGGERRSGRAGAGRGSAQPASKGSCTRKSGRRGRVETEEEAEAEEAEAAAEEEAEGKEEAAEVEAKVATREEGTEASARPERPAATGRARDGRGGDGGPAASISDDDEDLCGVCGGGDADDADSLVFCDGPGCDVIVHQSCYHIDDPLPEGDWFCAVCDAKQSASSKRGRELTPTCPVCPLTTGPFVRALKDEGSGWAHASCTMYHQGPGFVGTGETKEAAGFHFIHRSLRSLRCGVSSCGSEANRLSGAKLECAFGRCKEAFHPSCALAARYHIAKPFEKIYCAIHTQAVRERKARKPPKASRAKKRKL